MLSWMESIIKKSSRPSSSDPLPSIMIFPCSRDYRSKNETDANNISCIEAFPFDETSFPITWYYLNHQEKLDAGWKLKITSHVSFALEKYIARFATCEYDYDMMMGLRLSSHSGPTTNRPPTTSPGPLVTWKTGEIDFSVLFASIIANYFHFSMQTGVLDIWAKLEVGSLPANIWCWVRRLVICFSCLIFDNVGPCYELRRSYLTDYTSQRIGRQF